MIHLYRPPTLSDDILITQNTAQSLHEYARLECILEWILFYKLFFPSPMTFLPQNILLSLAEDHRQVISVRWKGTSVECDIWGECYFYTFLFYITLWLETKIWLVLEAWANDIYYYGDFSIHVASIRLIKINSK